MIAPSVANLTDCQLIAETQRTTVDEHRVTAELLSLIGELDTRRLYLGEGCSSLFAYCTQVLRLSEHAAFHRIEVARAARQFPVILDLVAAGDVTLTNVALLRPHLTPGNHEALLNAARHKSKREVECQIAQLAPRPDAKPIVRRVHDTCAERAAVPALASSAVSSVTSQDPVAVPVATPPRSDQPGARPVIAPLARERYLLRVTVSGETHAKLRRAQDLMRRCVRNGDPAAILDRALTLLVEHLERTKVARVAQPRPPTVRTPLRGQSRHIPAAVKRAVWQRDEGRCAFVGPRGRCTETGRLEFHHTVPFARGGPAETSNIALRCRAHNQFESEQLFGPWLGPWVPAEQNV